jgi:hypothetical protein
MAENLPGDRKSSTHSEDFRFREGFFSSLLDNNRAEKEYVAIGLISVTQLYAAGG